MVRLAPSNTAGGGRVRGEAEIRRYVLFRYQGGGLGAWEMVGLSLGGGEVIVGAWDRHLQRRLCTRVSGRQDLNIAPDLLLS